MKLISDAGICTFPLLVWSHTHTHSLLCSDVIIWNHTQFIMLGCDYWNFYYVCTSFFIYLKNWKLIQFKLI